MKLYITLLICVVLFAFAFKKPHEKGLTKSNKSNKLASLGHYLFFETKLSKNGIKSCASCHDPQFAFTDGYRVALSTEADLLLHNTPSILNLSNYKTLNWASPNIKNIVQQMQGPLFNKHPPEMGMSADNYNAIKNIETDPKYKTLLQQAGVNKLTWKIVVKCINEYVLKLNSRNAKYDKYRQGKVKLNKEEHAGMKLFFSKKLNCTSCHAGVDFNQTKAIKDNRFANIGLYNIGPQHQYTANDNGLFNTTHKASDIGKFRIPSLRNVMLTAPYFHDGSARNLEEVINLYSHAGRNITSGNYAGNGIKNPYKDKRLKIFSITTKQQKQLLAFFNTLTDTSYLQNPYFILPP